MVGIYGMLSFLVRQRRREIGIRMALGASPSNVRRRVLRHGLTIGAVGTLLGMGLALAIGRLVQPLLYGVAASDPRLLIGTAAALLVSVTAATLVPTRTATRTDTVAGDSRRVAHPSRRSRSSTRGSWYDAMMGSKGPKATGGSPASLWIYVDDCDALFTRAVAAGAQVLPGAWAKCRISSGATAPAASLIRTATTGPSPRTRKT